VSRFAEDLVTNDVIERGGGTLCGDRGRPLQMMDAGSTCLGSYTRGQAAPDLLV
jgi:hypothetical protein